ncbi:MAG TPA: hypothetical protein VNO21_20450, partial [Polyangiaceae bacterium]|nr:hypothetical protein [Polyangiaceae bacterium]
MIGAGAAACTGVSPPDNAPPESTDAHPDGRDSLGLRLVYEQGARRVDARMNRALESDEQLFVRLRRGTLTASSQRELSCADLAGGDGVAIAGGSGSTRFEGPPVSSDWLDLSKSFDAEVWATGPITEAMREEKRKGTEVIAEACLMKNGAARAKVQTTLGYLVDRARDENDAARVTLHASNVQPHAAPAIAEGQPIRSMEKYAELCVQDLGEIPFFRKKGDGQYETYDCRDFTGSDGNAAGTSIPGVEGAAIPLTVGDVRKDVCERDKPHDDGDDFANYDCLDRCDKPQYLTKGCEPGPTVSTARNDQGTHWVLLCRAADAPARDGMPATKTFRDMAMIGHNPKTGKTCFFQNKLGQSKDGAHIPHPADLEKSQYTWDSPKGYCTTSCHAADAFVHSPWIDGALRRNGKTIVPKMGEHPDFPISWLDAPYDVVNMDAQGWSIGRQLVSEKAAACTSCHRIAGPDRSRGMMLQFTAWGTLADPNASFFSKVTDAYQTNFEKSHSMPTNLDGLNAETWRTSKWKKAADHIIQCATSSNPDCVFADVPRGPLGLSAPSAPRPAVSDDELARSALRALGAKIADRNDQCNRCHDVNNTKIRRWAKDYERTMAVLNDASRPAAARVNGLRADPNDPASGFSPAKIGFLAAGAHLGTGPQIDPARHPRTLAQGRILAQLFADGDEYARFRKAVLMPVRADFDRLTPTEYETVLDWVGKRLPKLDEILPDTGRPTTCTDDFAGLAAHVERMRTTGWAAVNRDNQLPMFACDTSAALACFHQQRAGKDIFPKAEDTDFGKTWAGPQTTVRVLRELDFVGNYWTRSSADGRFAASGVQNDGRGGAVVVDLEAAFHADAPRTRDIWVNADYDPSFYPDNGGFLFQGEGAAFCQQSLLTNPAIAQITFNEPECSKLGSPGLYQSVGQTLGDNAMGDRFIVISRWVGDDGGRDLSETDPPPDQGPEAGVTIHVLVAKDSSGHYALQDTKTLPTPFEGDTMMSPSTSLIANRVAGSVRGQPTQLGYVIRRVTPSMTSTGYEFALAEEG